MTPSSCVPTPFWYLRLVAATIGLASLASGPPLFMQAPPPGAMTRPRVSSGQVPLSFEANRGQADTRVSFLSRGHGYTLFLTPAEAVLSLATSGPPEARPAAVHLQLVGANPRPTPEGLEPLPGRSHYLRGKDPRRWHTNVPHYARVRYRGVYPGIDLVYHGRQGRLEYDFVVAPGADPAVIRIGFRGASNLRLDENGNLVLRVGQGEVVQKAPLVYQETKGVRRAVSGRYVLQGRREVAFQVDPDYDRARALVIDPVIDYSTYLGGSEIDSGVAIAVDASGSAYVTGPTYSIDFPTANPVQGSHSGSSYYEDVFVTKLDPSGTSLVYSTYLGGQSADSVAGIAVDSSGSAYVTGFTYSTDFPVANALQPVRPGVEAAFVAKLEPSGAALAYSTYLGGTGGQRASGIAVDALGSAYVTGWTGSSDFPVANAIQPELRGRADAFVTKLDPAGTSLVYSTYLGGSDLERAHGIALDPSGHAYLTGVTDSRDFPTLNALQPVLVSDPTFSFTLPDAFVVKLAADGTAFVYSTYLGGEGADEGRAIAADPKGRAYVTGWPSRDFPLANPRQQVPAGPGLGDAFVARLGPTGSALEYSTYVGGTGWDEIRGIAADATGHAYVAGLTYSPDFPLERPDHAQGFGDAFVVKFAPGGDAFVYATLLGGSSQDWAAGVAVDATGSAYVTGSTGSTDFPTVNAFQPQLRPRGDAFVAKLTDGAPDPGPAPRPSGGRVEQDDPLVGFSGTWNSSPAGGMSGGGAALSQERKARAVLTFNGTGVRWIGYRDEWSGIAAVYVDNARVATVDTYASPSEYQAELFAVDGLSPGVHTIVVEATGTANPAATQAWVWVDAFDVVPGPSPSPTPSPTPTPTPSPTPPPAGGRIEESDTTAVSYSNGSWYSNMLPGHSGGTAAFAAEAGARATLTFAGTGVRWIGYRDEWSGIAHVYLDGVLAGTADAYASLAQYQSVLFAIDGLAPGTHSLAIEVAGQRNASSGGDWVWVDAFEVVP